MMPSVRLLALTVCVAATAYAEAPRPKAPPPKPTPTTKVTAKDAMAGSKMLAPIQVDSLTLTPIVAETAAAATGPKVDVLVLDVDGSLATGCASTSLARVVAPTSRGAT